MGLADFAKKKLNETLDKKMQIEEDAAKFYSYVSQHEDEIVADVNKYHMKMVNCDEVGIQSLARDVVRKLKHDENGAYVDAVQYRIYVQYNGNGDFSRLFIIRGYTGGNGNSIDTSTSASISTSVGEYDDEDDDDIDEIVSQVSESGSQRVKPQREESEEERREKKKGGKKGERKKKREKKKREKKNKN